MFCSKCGTQLSDNANFCKKCGHPQKAGVAPPSQQQSGTILDNLGGCLSASVGILIISLAFGFVLSFFGVPLDTGVPLGAGLIVVVLIAYSSSSPKKK